MSDELSNATRIAALEADVVRLTAELQGERDDLAKVYKAKAKLIDERDELRDYNQRLLSENVRLTNEAAIERERCGVLELALQAAAGKFKHIAENWGNSGDACALSDAVSEMQMEASQAETDTRHALDAAKFVGGGSE